METGLRSLGPSDYDLFVLSDVNGPRVLFCAFAEIPGASAVGTRMAQWLSVFGEREVDALCLQGANVAHIQRFGGARLLRIPNAHGKPFLQRIVVYHRALQRQIAADGYDLVWCGDLFSAAIAAPTMKQGASLVVEVSSIPSQRIRAMLHDDELSPEHLASIENKWREQERLAFRSARCVVLPSRGAARALAERIDPRRIVVVPRAVDLASFKPPTIEVSQGDQHLVAIFGGRESRSRAATTLALARALVSRLPASTRLSILGRRGAGDQALQDGLAQDRIADRVALADADSEAEFAAALGMADVVLVPALHHDEAEPFSVPHRALEAMACGRPVVLTGSERSFRDVVTLDEHLCVVPGEPAMVAARVASILADGKQRESLRRSAARHMERAADLVSRSREAARAVFDTTGAALRTHPPRIDDPENSASQIIRRRISGAMVAAKPNPIPKLRDAPTPALRADVEEPRVAPVQSEPVLPAAMIPDPVVVSDVFAEPAATGAPATAEAGSGVVGDDRPLQVAPVVSPHGMVQTVKVDGLQFGDIELGGAWEGDTFLDSDAVAVRHAPVDPEKVRAAMRPETREDSGGRFSGLLRRHVPEPVNLSPWSHSDEPLSLEDDEVEVVELGEGAQSTQGSTESTASAGSSEAALPRSLLLQGGSQAGSSHSEDPWARDTIADGTPLEIMAQAAPSAGTGRAPVRRTGLVAASVRPAITRVTHVPSDRTMQERDVSSEET